MSDARSRAGNSAGAATILIWAARLLFGLFFLALGGVTLLGLRDTVTEFDQIGFGHWFRYLAGLVEVIGAAALISSSISSLGAVLLLGVCIGTFFIQLVFLEQELAYPLVLGLAMVLMIFLQRDQIIAARTDDTKN